MKFALTIALATMAMAVAAPGIAQQGRENPFCSSYRSQLSNLRSNRSSATNRLRDAQSNISRYEQRYREGQLDLAKAKTDSERRNAESKMRDADSWIRHYTPSLQSAQREVDRYDREIGQVEDQMARAGCR